MTMDILIGAGITLLVSIMVQLFVNWLNRKRDDRLRKKKVIGEAIQFFIELAAVIREHYLKLEKIKYYQQAEIKTTYRLWEILPILELIENEIYSSRFQRVKYFLHILRNLKSKKVDLKDTGLIIGKIQLIQSFLNGPVFGQYQVITHNWYINYLDQFKIDIRDENREIPISSINDRVFEGSNLYKLLEDLNDAEANIQSLINALYEVQQKI